MEILVQVWNDRLVEYIDRWETYSVCKDMDQADILKLSLEDRGWLVRIEC